MNPIHVQTTAPGTDYNHTVNPHRLTHPASVQPPSKPMKIPTASSSRFQPTITSFTAPSSTVLPTEMFKPASAVAAMQTSRPAASPATPSPPITLPASAPAAPSPLHSSSPVSSDTTPSPTPSPQPTCLPPLANNRTPFKPTAPVEIPPLGKTTAPPTTTDPRPRIGTPTFHLSIPSSQTLPDAIPNISPSYPATLFGGLSPDDEHVTVWEPTSGKTVAGNAAPYRRNLVAWLQAHPGWEEKADELKSSKRRSAARRSRIAAQAFAAACCYRVATVVARDAARHLTTMASIDHCNEAAMAQWTVDDFVRLQECLCKLAQDVHKVDSDVGQCDAHRWTKITHELGTGKLEGTVVYCAHHMLTRGIRKSVRELGEAVGIPAHVGSLVEYALPPSSLIGSPASPGSMSGSFGEGVGEGLVGSLPSPGAAAVLERSFRAPREPRVTVWNPENGRTISGNAAPCRRNLDAWMKQHPGWLPKEEGQLSSSRRNRNRKTRPASAPIATNASASAAVSVPEAESPHFNDALEGLLVLSRSPHAGSEETLQGMQGASVLDSNVGNAVVGVDRDSSSGMFSTADDVAVDDGMDDGNDDDDEVMDEHVMDDGSFVPTSSVSCSSVENGSLMSDEEDVREDSGAEDEDDEGSDMEL